MINTFFYINCTFESYWQHWEQHLSEKGAMAVKFRAWPIYCTSISVSASVNPSNSEMTDCFRAWIRLGLNENEKT